MKKWPVSIVEKRFHFRENQGFLSKKIAQPFKIGYILPSIHYTGIARS